MLNKIKSYLNAKRFEKLVSGCDFTYIVLPTEQDHCIKNCTIEDWLSVSNNACFGGGVIATTKGRYFIITKEDGDNFAFSEIDKKRYEKTLDFITQPVL